MLRELRLSNLGVIADASVEFAPGLNVVTGETGAGKTLLVGSLELVCGGRGQGRLVAAGTDEASVEAVFDALPDPPPDLGLEATEDVVVCRRIGADGRSRAWLNGRTVPLSVLAELGERLVEIAGQGAGFALARPATQLAAVDALAGAGDVLAEFRRELALLRAMEREREELAASEAEREREAELLSFQADEIERASLQPGEDEMLDAEHSRLEHAERLGEIAGRVLESVGSEGAAGRLAEAHKVMVEASALDPRAAGVAERVGEAAAIAADAATDLRAWSSGLEPDPVRLESLRERRALIASLKRKYGASIEEVLEAGRRARARVAELRARADRSEAIHADETAARERVERLRSELGAARARAARELTELVTSELPALALARATFEVRCETAPLTENGGDRVEFLFAESSARPPDAIGKVASGGELSRAMIAVTLALAQAHAVPVLVFDEADQGVGGQAALELARRLARLGRTHQVLVVSHLPQIAAFADRHIVVRRSGKRVVAEPVDEESRLAEIARMLAGLGTSELGRGHAAELVELARRERDKGRVRPRAG